MLGGGRAGACAEQRWQDSIKKSNLRPLSCLKTRNDVHEQSKHGGGVAFWDEGVAVDKGEKERHSL